MRARSVRYQQRSPTDEKPDERGHFQRGSNGCTASLQIHMTAQALLPRTPKSICLEPTNSAKSAAQQRVSGCVLRGYACPCVPQYHTSAQNRSGSMSSERHPDELGGISGNTIADELFGLSTLPAFVLFYFGHRRDLHCPVTLASLCSV